MRIRRSNLARMLVKIGKLELRSEEWDDGAKLDRSFFALFVFALARRRGVGVTKAIVPQRAPPNRKQKKAQKENKKGAKNRKG